MLRWLKLDRITPEKQAMRAKAKRALMRFTGAAIGTLREDDEEFLQGEQRWGSWRLVARDMQCWCWHRCAMLKSLCPSHPHSVAGANWQAVGRYVDVSDALKKFDPPLPPAQAWAISSAASPGSKQSLPGGETDAKGAQQVSYA